MLNKLLKYDLKWVFKPLIVFYILLLIFSFIIRIVESFELTLILLVIDKVCVGIVISMMASILINCFMRNWVRFIRNIYKDESYLTHTLPVSKNSIFLSKVLTMIITLFVSLLIIVLSLVISILNKDTLVILKESLESLSLYFNSSIYSLIISLFLVIFFEFMFIMLCGIIGIILGHSSSNLKVVKSIIYGFIIFVLFSTFSLILIYIYGLINNDIMNIFKTTIVSSSSLVTLLHLSIIIYFIYITIIYLIGNRLLNNGVNVE